MRSVLALIRDPLAIFCLVIAAAVLTPLVAFMPPLATAAAAAGSSAPVTIDIGADVSAMLAWARDLIVACAYAAAMCLLPLPVRIFVTNNMLERAVDYAIAQVNGAAKGKTISVDLANEVLNEAVVYVLARGPKIARQLGDHLKPMLLARLSAKTVLPSDSVGVPIDAAGPGGLSL